jgi:hypothetical protein|uniref:Uncharacterized protein n=1 Tax=viral metagenome TaxID=1070528 RepID=A0A6C0ALU2_9ZZZZ
MASKFLFKSFIVANTSFGIYGFSRGYRGTSEYDNNTRLTTQKIFNGTISGIFYMIPPWNLYFIKKLLNRIEIKYRNLDKNLYNYEYDDLTGECKDTI